MFNWAFECRELKPMIAWRQEHLRAHIFIPEEEAKKFTVMAGDFENLKACAN